jgi:hypothetical protein
MLGSVTPRRYVFVLRSKWEEEPQEEVPTPGETEIPQNGKIPRFSGRSETESLATCRGGEVRRAGIPCNVRQGTPDLPDILYQSDREYTAA